MNVFEYRSSTPANDRGGFVRRFAALVFAAAAVLMLGACAPAEEAPEAGDVGEVTEATQGDDADAMGGEDEADAQVGTPDDAAGGEGDGETRGASPGDMMDTVLTIYSGRRESLVGPLVEQFSEDTGIEVEIRYGETAEMAALLLEEGDRSPADVFLAQDPGGLGAVSEQFAPLPDELLDRVDPRFRDPRGRWTGVSGRARVIAYNTESLAPEDLPETLEGFTDEAWRGRLGWAPTNASFQTMVTAMRAAWGEDRTRAWLEGILANEPQDYPSNTPLVQAVALGEVEAGFTNHYYLYRFLAEEGEGFGARNHFLPGGGPGSLVMVAGVGVLASSDGQEAAEALVDYLLSESAQTYFSASTFEYPLAADVEPSVELPPLASLNAVDIPLEELADLPGTVELLQDVGALP